jgi:GGDEF domain-containing protein
LSKSRTYTNIPRNLAKAVELPAAAAFNMAAYSNCLLSVSDPEIGLFNEGCFFWFLSLEFDRYQRFKTPFSILLISLNKSDIRAPLMDFGQKLKSSIRSVDQGCLYQNCLALILPQSETGEAALCAERLAKLIADELGNERFSIGIASVPTSCEHPGVLIAAALQASEFARLNDRTVMVFGQT